ncbi:CLP1 [Candida theae]|uniref:Polynucleotide 5'-hydroxyl-kinase GRC3 n=1 Tax=Candida theae TaxID=1198502 RepID=A0AAD5G154_9ASCO|nr:CLP1 [Candida theae]KAI5968492.1 CLP1 [Candida theae]
MSIPGLGSETTYEDSLKSVVIPQGSEWRIEIPVKQIIKFKVTEGILEINGTELPNNVELQLTGTKGSIYSPKQESKLEYTLVQNQDMSMYEDEEFSEYVSSETNMESVLNLHMYLESKRQAAADHNVSSSEKEPILGPRIMVLGGRHSGKTTLAKTLISYAVKMDHCPILVNLNPQDGVFALPGSISATAIGDSLDIESCSGYGLTTTTTGGNPLSKQPIVKNYGFTTINENMDLYKYQVSQLGITVVSRLEQDLQCGNSGVVVDTPPLGIKEFDVIESIIGDFRIDLIVVVGNEKLSIDLQKKLSHKSNLQIVKLNKSPGVVEVSDKFIRMSQEATIREYFNGNYKTRLSPFKTDIDATGLQIFKAVKDSVSLSFLPAGDDFERDETDNDLSKYYSPLDPSSSNVDNSIIVVTHLQSSTPGTDLLHSSVLGYIHVSKFDDEKKKLKVLLPFPGVFPRNVLIATDIGYNE